jgi:outer membrane lipoprotein-sorting protein
MQKKAGQTVLFAMVLTATLAGASAPESSPAAAPSPDAHAAPLTEAIARFQSIDTYRVTIHSVHADGEEHIRYFFRKPGYVRMEFIKPHAGALLIYSPETGRVRLWPFGFGHFPELNLSPANPLIRSSRDQHVDHSDVGALYDNIRSLQEHGSTELVGRENMNGRPVLHLNTTGMQNYSVAGVHSFEWWLDSDTLFPVRVVSRDAHDTLLETVDMDALEINPALPQTTFSP